MQEVQGKVAGLVIVQPGGDPNGNFIVRIRGATSLEGQPPLLVIDGVAMDSFNVAISGLNPADIESFTVLKDASSAAIYGSRGANGVILVTTKSARAGKISVDYNGFVGIENISKEINVLNGDQYRVATGDSSGLDQGANTNWQKAISQTGFSQSHLIALNGGTDLFNFRGSIGYISQQGVVQNTGKQQITARLTAVEKSLNKKLEIRYGLNTSAIYRNEIPGQDPSGYYNVFGSGIFGGALGSLPVVPVYNPDGTYNRPNNQNSPVYYLNETYNKQEEDLFQISVKADYKIIPSLIVGGLGALTRGNIVYNNFSPNQNFLESSANKDNQNKQNYSGDLHANWREKFGKQTIDLTFVYEYNKFENDGFAVQATGFLLPNLLNNNLGAANAVYTSGISSYKNEVLIISYVGRLVYNYDERYLFTATFRRDGSSKFGPDNAWGNFPSFAVGWRLSNEKFIKAGWLDNLKLRASFGYTGNQENLSPYPYQLLYGPVGPYWYNGQAFQSYNIVQQPNADLKWEQRQSFDLGLDFSIWGDRLAGTIDVFNDKTSNMLYLYPIPQPPFLYNYVTANAASAENKGVELTLNAGIIRKKNFRWDINFNISWLKSYVTNLNGEFQGSALTVSAQEQHYGYAIGGGLSGVYISQLQVGYPIGVFWLPQHAGVDQAGHELYNHYVNGKLAGVSTSFTDSDRVYINPTPHYTWGLTSSFSYGNFDLVFLLRGVQGQKIYANSLYNLGAKVYLPYRNVSVEALSNGFSNQPQPSTYWLKDGSFTRLENITLGYNFKKIKGINLLRLYVTATNLFIITSYEGIDPEIRTDGSQRYIDDNYYPKTRGFVFGINLGF